MATVSRVFNGYPDVSAETRLRVMAWARKLDYTPNAAARTLVKRRSQLIGVILFTGESHPDLQHPFFLEVLVGLKHSLGAGLRRPPVRARAAGIRAWPACVRTARTPSRRRRCGGTRSRRCGGAGAAEADRLGHAGRAVDLALVGERATTSPSTTSAAPAGVRHLHDLGHRRIATIVGLAHTKPAADRLLGYRAELRELGLTPTPGYEAAGDFYLESGEAAMRALLALPEPPTAVFAASDMMAVGAIRAIEDAGLRCRTTSPSSASTTSSLPSRQSRADHDPPGEASTRRRCGAIARPADRRHGDGAARLRASGELVVRESCGAAKGVAASVN